MIDDIRAFLARLGYKPGSVIRLGEGLDNLVYEVDGLVVRLSKESDAAARSELVRREAAVLAAVGELATLPVPVPVLTDAEAGVIAYRKVPGAPLLSHPVAHPERLAPALGEFVSSLHRAPLTTMAALVPRDAVPLMTWLAEAEEHYRQVANVLPPATRPAVEEFLGRTPPAEATDLVFCHNDLGSEHILVDAAANAVTGVIDWTDAAIADRVCDLALIYRDLGPEVFDRTLDHYEGHVGDPGRARAVFYARCALLEDISFGLETGVTRYVKAGLAHLDWTFARSADW